MRGYRKDAPTTEKTLLLGLAPSLVYNSFPRQDLRLRSGVEAEVRAVADRYGFFFPRRLDQLHGTHFGQWGDRRRRDLSGLVSSPLAANVLQRVPEGSGVRFDLHLAFGLQILVNLVPIPRVVRFVTFHFPAGNIPLDQLHPDFCVISTNLGGCFFDLSLHRSG